LLGLCDLLPITRYGAAIKCKVRLVENDLISSGSEDYRWVHVHKWFPNAVVWTLFNFGFISTAQSFILLALATPYYNVMLATPSQRLTWQHVLLACTHISLICIEAMADHQQNVYQAFKRGRTGVAPPYCSKIAIKRGFLAGGLFAYLRHPNFIAEQLIWWVVYAYGALSSKSLINWTIIGPISLNAIFFGSTLLTETLSQRKYPIFKVYQQNVGMFLPWGMWTEALDQKYVK
jgi:steroid 5-alpha reductase family enzyme